MTARPLADCTLAPSAPARESSASSVQKPLTREAASSASPQPPTPLASTQRSPTRSAASPHGMRLTTEPTREPEMSSPVCPSDRCSSVRSAGAITATPNQMAEYVACANVPAARTAVLYLRASEPERVRRPRARVRDDRLGLEVEIERLEGQLPPEAGLLVTAERDARKGGVRHVDPDRAGLDPRGDAMPPARIPRPDRRHQPVLDVVRDPHGVGFVVERDHRHDG